MSSTPSTPIARRSGSAGWTILIAGLIAGALDIGFVYVYFHPADRFAVLRGIAAGLLGRDRVKGSGLGIALLGLLLHFVIALGAAAVFYAASRKLTALARHPFVSGPLYGVVVWLVMNLIVLPLSANPPKTFPAANWVPVFVAHLICVGLPIALVVHLSARARARP
jgi:hypothetical protein